MPILRPTLAAALGLATAAYADETLPRGAFAIETVLEIPNISAPAWRGTRLVCLLGDAGGALPVPVLSPNNPFRNCAATEVERTGAVLRYRIVCPGRDAARASASYVLGPDGFHGEVAMVLGAKNMTLSERQVGRRAGRCAPDSAATAP